MERRSRTIETALVPCAGLGTRLLPMTRVLPKELLPYRDRPMIHHVLEEMHEAGIRRVVLVVRPDKDLLERHLAAPYPFEDRASCPVPVPSGMEVRFAWQARADGLAGALRAARPELPADRPFLLVFPDQLLLGTPGAAAQMAAVYDGPGSLAALVRIPAEDARFFPGARGLAVEGTPPLFDLTGLLGEETPPALAAPGFEVRAFGRTILEPALLDLLPDSPDDRSFGTAYAAYLASGRHRALLLEGTPVDLGTREGYRHFAGGLP